MLQICIRARKILIPVFKIGDEKLVEYGLEQPMVRYAHFLSMSCMKEDIEDFSMPHSSENKMTDETIVQAVIAGLDFEKGELCFSVIVSSQLLRFSKHLSAYTEMKRKEDYRKYGGVKGEETEVMSQPDIDLLPARNWVELYILKYAEWEKLYLVNSIKSRLRDELKSELKIFIFVVEQEQDMHWGVMMAEDNKGHGRISWGDSLYGKDP